MQYLFEPAMLPFGVALVLMVGIGLLEGVAMVLGAGLSQFLDSLLPNTDIDVDGDIDLGEIGSASALSKLLGWLCIGKVPVLVLLILFLASFGLIGIAIQNMVNGLTGIYLFPWLASIPAVFFSLPVVRLGGNLIAKVIPQDETSAISQESFIGRVVIITLGTAEKGQPAQGKFQDRYGQAHYLMVEPEKTGEKFERNDAVLLLSRASNCFIGVRNTNENLVD